MSKRHHFLNKIKSIGPLPLSSAYCAGRLLLDSQHPATVTSTGSCLPGCPGQLTIEINMLRSKHSRKVEEVLEERQRKEERKGKHSPVTKECDSMLSYNLEKSNWQPV